MKNFTLCFFLVTSFLCAQVGIGTTDPKSTLDIVGQASVVAAADGIIAPRLTLVELSTKTAGTYGINQIGAILYISSIVGGTPAGSTANILAPGYYYFDGLIWQSIGGASASGTPFNLDGTTTDADSNKTASIVRAGAVAIGSATVDTNAILDLTSTSKGLLLPRLTPVEREAIVAPTNGMLIYNTVESCINIYNVAAGKWKSICGVDANGSAQFTSDCSSLTPSGVYSTGVALVGSQNFLTLTVNVTELGTYQIVTDSGGMLFSAAGEFTTLGTHDIILEGQGYPLVTGNNFLSLNINDSFCTVVINVLNGLANVTSCGTTAAFTGDIYANEAVISGNVYQSYSAGPAFTGGGVYGITSAAVNGIRINQPINGTFSASGAPIDYLIAGTALQPGATTLNYSINGFACSFPANVQSGTGKASAVNCGGALSGAYNVGSPMGAGNTKVVTLTVSTPGTFYIRTNTVNGFYYAGSATAAVAGALNVTLTAVGTPSVAQTDTFTVTASASPTTYTTCTFNVITNLPAIIPNFQALNTSCNTATAGISYIKSSNSDSNDRFGGYIDDATYFFGGAIKVSANGLSLIASAIGEKGSIGGINSTDNNSSTSTGAVYIYTRPNKTSNWVFQSKIKPIIIDAFDNFGNAVDISDDGTKIVVGAMQEDGSGTGVNPANNNSASNSGAAYIFHYTGTTWVQDAILKPHIGTSVNDFFGGNVAISGDGEYIAVGAIGEDTSSIGINAGVNEGKSSSGAVYTYKHTGSNAYAFDTFFKANQTDVDDWFGTDVDLNTDGSTLAVGALNEDGSNTGVNPTNNNSTSNAGAAYIFKRTGATWIQEAYIKASQINVNDTFGLSVSIDGSGNRLVVGSKSEDGNGKGVNSAINESSSNSGAAYVYSRSGSTWTPTAYLKAKNTTAGDRFGRSVAISKNGDHILVGAPEEDTAGNCVNSTNLTNTNNNQGAMYSFSFVGGSWVASHHFKQPQFAGHDANDFLGYHVTIDEDGKTVIGAAGNEDGSGRGVNPASNNSAGNSGAAYIFTAP